MCIRDRSFGKHDPPYPGPGCKNLSPILLSKPIPRAISSTSAPTFSQRSAISLIKIILIANIELLAYLINSEDRLVVKIIGKSSSTCFLYIEFRVNIEFLFFVPRITLSGFSKSKIAEPSLKNSGFETTSKSMEGFTNLIISSTLSAIKCQFQFTP